MECLVHEGWLVKSPPEKRIVKAKWRQRWFVLRHSGLLPGQFILEYFTDNTCKKLKGRIDLDQCEQVDAGISFDSKRTSYQHMFDIRTPKRTYYLVAETEAEMNKWVECICSVCNLKIHMEEDFLVPQDSNASSNNNNVTTQPVSSHSKYSSNPYIPISECHTGKPILNGLTNDLSIQGNHSASSSVNNFGCSDLPKDPPPPPPKIDLSSISDEFYDHPKPLGIGTNNLNTSTSDIDGDDTYKVPIQSKTDLTHIYNNDVFSTLPPPKVNWNTYPEGSGPPSCSTVPRRKSSVKEEVNVYDVVPSFHGSIKDIKPQPRKVQTLASHFENLNVQPSVEEASNVTENDSIYVNQTSSVPPRPPKPSKLRERHRYENFELPLQAQKEDKHIYDVPPLTKNSNTTSDTVSLSKADNSENPSADSSSVKESTIDDTYDFPKFRTEEDINIPVPLSQNTGTSQRTRRHAYTNAPPGLFNSKDLIFNYEYRPSLMTSDGYLSGDAMKNVQSSSDAATPPSPSAIGAYANVPTSPTLSSNFLCEMPPAVNRELKPKRNVSNEDRGSFSFLTLQPPPVCRSRTKADKRSFRKTRAAPSPTPISSLNGMPPVPNRFRHHPEMSATSDDEVSNSSGSRRNSSNDDQVRHLFPAPTKKDEIQYLDLDLDSEPSPSPKTPERMSASTVYKKVDFVKTKAFNEMRQNVEESYRKSQ